jgi:CheY-like chemotaxis protein
VLVVEDDRALSELLVCLLETEGFSAVPARDGMAALRLADQLRPDLITLDLDLPALPGQLVLECLADDEATRSIPVVVFSASVDDLCPTRQVRRALSKPFGITELPGVVRECVGSQAVA